jgi:hypothetical protein
MIFYKLRLNLEAFTSFIKNITSLTIYYLLTNIVNKLKLHTKTVSPLGLYYKNLRMRFQLWGFKREVTSN